MKADPIHIEIISSGGEVIERTAHYVSIPTEEGPVGVLAGHLPMLASFGKGIVRCKSGEGEELRVRVGQGVAHVADNRVMVLTDDAEVEAMQDA